MFSSDPFLYTAADKLCPPVEKEWREAAPASSYDLVLSVSRESSPINTYLQPSHKDKGKARHSASQMQATLGGPQLSMQHFCIRPFDSARSLDLLGQDFLSHVQSSSIATPKPVAGLL